MNHHINPIIALALSGFIPLQTTPEFALVKVETFEVDISPSGAQFEDNVWASKEVVAKAVAMMIEEHGAELHELVSQLCRGER